jgi:hypothetical protein
MSFSDLKTALGRLDSKIEAACGRRLFDEITIQEPAGELGELYFSRLVSWSYVVLNEAGALPLNYLRSLLRVSDPEALEVVNSTRQTVINLRTVQAHNLPPTDSSNQHKARQASIWISQHGGDPPNWALCCEALASQMLKLINNVESAWVRATSDSSDRTQTVEGLVQRADQTWEAHTFDGMIESAAQELGIDGLDVVAYRADHLEEWRNLTAYFVDRESAKRSVAIAIRNQLAEYFVHS